MIIITSTLILSFFIFVKASTLDELKEHQKELVSIEDDVWSKFEVEEAINDNKISAFNFFDKINEQKMSITRLYNKFFWFVAVLGAMGLFVAGLISSIFAKTHYIHLASCHLDSLFKIIRPYTTVKKYNQLQSEYAQIRSSSDYEKLTLELYQIANENKLNYMEINVW